MDYEVKIKELTDRIAKLEAAENKRIAKRRREIAFKIIKYGIIIGLIVAAYIHINNTFIKPYKEKVDFVNEKMTSVEKFVEEKWEALQKYNPFK